MVITNTGKKRQDWIDALRGIAMIIVMIWHMSNGLDTQWIFSLYTAPIMIPLFFSITGYVFNDCKGDAYLFYKKLLFHIIIPWVGLALGKALLIALLRHSANYFVEYAVGVITGLNLWYMPCCVFSEIIHFYIRKYSKKTSHVAILSFLVMVLGYILAKNNILNLMCINIALVVQGFYFLGYLAKTNEAICKHSNRLAVLCALVYFGFSVISLICYKGYCMDVHKNNYYNIPLCTTMIISGCLLCFVIAPRLKKYPKMLTFIGRNTLVFYIFHYDTIKPFEKICLKLGFVSQNWCGVIYKFLWSLLVCSIIAIILNRYAPLLVGKKKISSNRVELVQEK